jgi:crotonobetainyl-CoA:carnitine CoA-transferase CaiB-like acyl-CoA transferase
MLAGPFCTALLADVGAEVIKVEPPNSGDDARHFAPRRGGESGYFMLLNRGKKSITLDLKSPRGQELLRVLACQSDVVVENYRPGVAARLGVDYATLAKINPRLIYCSISGFGQSGQLAARPAYDIIAQAMSGLMSITGTPDGPPTRVGESLGDLVTGTYASWGILTALAARERTGKGQQVEVAMLDSLFSYLITAMTQYLYGGVEPRRIGNRHPISTPYDSYRAKDGYVVIAVANEPMFRRFAEAIGRTELPTDRRFASDEERTRNEPALRAVIEAWANTRTVAQVVAELDAAGVPVGPIWSVAEAAQSQHVASRGLLAEVDHPTAGRIPVLMGPVHFSATPPRVSRAAPLLGEHSASVLRELAGISEDEIERLRQDGVI